MPRKMRAMWAIERTLISCSWCFADIQSMSLEDVKYLGNAGLRCPNCAGINVLPGELIAKADGVLAKIDPDNPPGRAPSWEGIIGNLVLRRAMEIAITGYHTLAYVGDPSIAWDNVAGVLGPRAIQITRCPCGNYLEPFRECTCSYDEIETWCETQKYEEAVACDLQVEAVAPLSDELFAWREPYGSVLQRIKRVRFAQQFGRASFGDRKTLRSRDTLSFLSGLRTRMDLTTTQLQSMCRVAQTIAELEGDEWVSTVHVAEAAGFKTLLHP